MVREIFVGIFVAVVILYLFYLYLAWSDKYAASKTLYKYSPYGVTKDQKETLEKYGALILPEYLSDTYKPLRFSILYFANKYF